MKYKLLVLVVLVSLTTGVSAAEVEVVTQQEWNQGDFSGTSADRSDNSGDLGLGYRNGTSSDSLIGYWRLDRSVSGSGGTVLDYSGNAYDGTARNGVNTGVQGVFSTDAFDFDGSNDYVEIPSAPQGANEAPFTYSAWIHIDGSTGENQYLVSNGAQSYSEGGSLSYDESGNNLQWSVQTDGVGASIGAGISFGNWHHIVGVWDGSTQENAVKLFIDGNLAAEGTATSRTQDPQVSGLAIGAPDNSLGNYIANGRIEEVSIYNKVLSHQEINQLYLESNPFSGNYSKEFSNSEATTWNEIEVDMSSLPTDTDVDAVFRAKDSSDNLVDEQVIDLQEGKKNYSLEVSDSEKAEIVFNGSSSDVTSSWEIEGFKVYAGFCDYRGPKNECVMNSTRQLRPQTYDVNSIFEARSKAVFEAFSGTSVLDVSNSSRLSGTWKGSFDIQSNPVTIEPGASFKPTNGRIIIGK
jgi:hypothetical protein